MPEQIPSKGENESTTVYWTRVICYDAWNKGHAAGFHNAVLQHGGDGDPDDRLIRNPYAKPETT